MGKRESGAELLFKIVVKTLSSPLPPGLKETAATVLTSRHVVDRVLGLLGSGAEQPQPRQGDLPLEFDRASMLEGLADIARITVTEAEELARRAVREFGDAGVAIGLDEDAAVRYLVGAAMRASHLQWGSNVALEQALASVLPLRVPTMRRGMRAGALGDFELIRLLGQGASAEVWLAEELGSGRRLAFKFFTNRAINPSREEEFAERVQRLRHGGEPVHPGISAPVLWDFRASPAYIAYEYHYDTTLADYILRRYGATPVPEFEVWVLAGLFARPVAWLHSHDMIHGDLKPSNILLWEEGNLRSARLADFGSSRTSGTVVDTDVQRQVSEADEHITLTVSGGYTPFYSDKFGRWTDGRLGPRYDLYSLGVILFQICTLQLSKRIGLGWREEIASRGYSDETVELIHQCIAEDLSLRFESANELRERVEALEEQPSSWLEKAWSRSLLGKAWARQWFRSSVGISAILWGPFVLLVLFKILGWQDDSVVFSSLLLPAAVTVYNLGAVLFRFYEKLLGR